MTNLNEDIPNKSSQKYLDFVLKYYTYDMFKTYFSEIKTAYQYMLENASQAEADELNKFLVDLNVAGSSYKRITRENIYYIERDTPETAKIPTSTDEEKDNIEKTISLFKTWDDCFLNNDPAAMLIVLKGLHIREWLQYKVEYELPKKLIPQYKSKVEIFLKTWGI
jgi:hypothetical protein